jgi:GNAT superfamily N-acetyltransferase
VKIFEIITEAKKGAISRGGLVINFYDSNGVLVVTATTRTGKELGNVEFEKLGPYLLVAHRLEVDERYQRQGIASEMYDAVKDEGYTIQRSNDQTDAGKSFWDKHKGEDEDIWESSKYLGPTTKVKMDKKGWQVPLNKKGFGV